MFSECKIPRAWNTNIHLQMVLGNTTNSQKHHGTFEVFIDATVDRENFAVKKISRSRPTAKI